MVYIPIYSCLQSSWNSVC